MKAAIYVRVSTLHQADKDSLPMQKKDLIAYADLVLGIQDYDIFEDAGYSGKNTYRPAFREMMDRIRQGEFTHLLVWKIDRISRNLLDFSQMYKELQRLRVTFVSKNEQFDTSTAIGEAMLKIILVFAELERNMAVERVTATMISRAASGIWNGGRTPFGYDYDGQSFSINPQEAETCRLMRDDYLQYNSIRHTVMMLNRNNHLTRNGNLWTSMTVWHILSSPFYAGLYRYNTHRAGGTSAIKKPKNEWITTYDHHPAIFTIDQHNQIRAILTKNQTGINVIGQAHRSKNTHVFAGLLFCGKCGSKLSSMIGKKMADNFRTTLYRCPVARKSEACDNRFMSESIIGEFVINYILNVLNVQKNIALYKTPPDLQKRLLQGSAFSDVDYIAPDGLNGLYRILVSYNPDHPRSVPIGKPKKQKPLPSIRKEKERQERALNRLNDVFLYGEMSEKEYLLKHAEISSRIQNLTEQMGSQEPDQPMSDDEFIRIASHLLIFKYLQEKQYINYKTLIRQVSPDVLRQYMTAVLKSVYTYHSRVLSVTFKNGITTEFVYKKKAD